MSTLELSDFFNKPCKYKLRSGREVFGVIWLEQGFAEKQQYYFSSAHFYDEALKAALVDENHPIIPRERTEIDINEILMAEIIAEIN